MKPTREMVKQRLEALEGQATKAAVLEAWDGLDIVERALGQEAAWQKEVCAWVEIARAKIYRALGGDA